VTVPELVDRVPRRALAVYAHPDDADVACGGTLAWWAEAGCEVHLVVCTDGGRGTTDPDASCQELARRRAKELAEAAEIIGLASHRNLGLPDGELEDTRDLRGELVGVIRQLQPDVVCGHDPTAIFFGQHYFNHRDHRTAGWALLDALAPAAALPQYFPERGYAHRVDVVYLSGTLEPNVWVDISATIERKVGAVLCHQSQLAEDHGWAREAVLSRAAEEGRRAGVPYAEGFRRLYLTP